MNDLILYNEICQSMENLHNLVNQYFYNDQCMWVQRHVWIKEPLKFQDGPKNLTVKSMKSSSIRFKILLFNQTKKLQLVEFWCNIKEEHPQLSEKAVILFPFPAILLVRLDFSYTSNKIIYCNRLNTESDRRVKLSD